MRFATFLAPCLRPVYEAVTAEVGRKLGVHTELVTGSSYEEFEHGRFDAAFVCGLPYVQLARHDPPPMVAVAAPVLAGARYGYKPVYYSDVIVAAGSRFATFEDLRGATFAYNEPRSHSGCGVVRYHLARLGAPRGFFGKAVRTGFHERAVNVVASGGADAAAIDSQVLEVILRDRPDVARSLRVVASLGPSTIQPLVVSSALPHDLVESIREALVLMNLPAFEHGLVERLVSVGDSDYDDIRAMLAAADQAEAEL